MWKERKQGAVIQDVGTPSRTDHCDGPRCRASAIPERHARIAGTLLLKIRAAARPLPPPVFWIQLNILNRRYTNRHDRPAYINGLPTRVSLTKI